ncbi:dynein heavy chain 2, axonemal-like isoform X2 [Aedes aegypti]|uniref:Dynein heavy chain AAA 5 extension domain-containing protein n=1 Tax=Aedes aegypti TaxID=7159 RepID=A0A6I8U5V8_AEDAE|nr:dynein heavy chain 2, axonemal-like isoform X2 [Aedes aegypti]
MSYLEALFYNDKSEVGSLEVKQINVQNDFCSLNLMHSSYLKTKTKQILDAFKTYSQIIITGAVCSGKSSLISLVLQNLSQEGMHFKQYYVHPMTLNETHDINSSEDNTVSGILKSILQSKTYKQKCVIFDGPLCDSWLENIAFDRSCVRSDSLNISDEENVVKFVIETVDLQCATPAYVSSFSIIYIQDGNLTYRQLLFTWLENKKWPTYMKDELLNLIDKYIGVFINFKHQECTLTAVYTDVAVLHTFCALYENVFIEWNNKKIYDNEALIREAIKKLFIFCCVWSVGGLMSEMERLKYDIFVRELVSDSTSSFPLKGTIFQYYVNTTNDACIWEQWIMDINEPSR